MPSAKILSKKIGLMSNGALQAGFSLTRDPKKCACQKDGLDVKIIHD
jgi:hypothetical protein